MTTLNHLKPNPKNPRRITDDKLSALKKALTQFGDLGGFVYNRKTKQLVGGHQRAKVFASSEIKITKTFEKPTRTGTLAEGYVLFRGERFKYREVEWDINTEKAANIAANKGAGEWDTDILSEWMRDLSKNNFDLDTTMFDKDEIDGFLSPTKSVSFEATTVAPGEDEVPELPKRAQTKLGDVIQLGPHRLMCGDSLEIGNVEKLLGNYKPDLLFTDPPYKHNMSQGSKFKGEKKHKHHALLISDLNDFDPLKLFPVIDRFKPQSVYMFCSKALIPAYLLWAEDRGSWNLLVMGKNNPVPLKGNKYLPDIEWLVFSRKNGAYFNDSLEHDWYRQIRMVSVKGAEFGHPTEKQVGYIEPFLQISAPPGGVVLDLFGGSGTTLIACQKVNRRCLMMELSPLYCDVIVARWEKFTGKKAKRL